MIPTPTTRVQMVIYTYDVAGVQYECSQDVTHLRQFLDLHSCRIGVATSVKYDPQPPRQLDCGGRDLVRTAHVVLRRIISTLCQ